MSIALFNEPASHIELMGALLARLNSSIGLAGLQEPWVAYRRDKAPETGGDYAIVDVLRTAGGNRRIGGGIAPSRWYATVTAIGSSVQNASIILRRSTIALVGFEIVVGSDRSTGIDFDGSNESVIEQTDYDRSLYAGGRTFTFAF